MLCAAHFTRSRSRYYWTQEWVGVVWGEGSRRTDDSVPIHRFGLLPPIKRHSAYLECPAPPRPSDLVNTIY